MGAMMGAEASQRRMCLLSEAAWISNKQPVNEHVSSVIGNCGTIHKVFSYLY